MERNCDANAFPTLRIENLVNISWNYFALLYHSIYSAPAPRYKFLSFCSHSIRPPPLFVLVYATHQYGNQESSSGLWLPTNRTYIPFAKINTLTASAADAWNILAWQSAIKSLSLIIHVQMTSRFSF